MEKEKKVSEPANSRLMHGRLATNFGSCNASQVKPSLKFRHGYCLLSLTLSPRGQHAGEKVASHCCPDVVRRNGCEANTGLQQHRRCERASLPCQHRCPAPVLFNEMPLRPRLVLGTADDVSKPSQPPAPIRSACSSPSCKNAASNFQCLCWFSLLFLQDVVTYD